MSGQSCSAWAKLRDRPNTACRTSARKQEWHTPCLPRGEVRKRNGCQRIGMQESGNHIQARMRTTTFSSLSTMNPNGTYRLLCRTFTASCSRADATSNGLEGIGSRYTQTGVCLWRSDGVQQSKRIFKQYAHREPVPFLRQEKSAKSSSP